ncbi:ISAs1 family transposase [Bacteroidales bacterium OttesenSCG-928-A14]|nr:ISAs1 family transposase [Bacteroidales bacterium OttesenSCG-928-A14]
MKPEILSYFCTMEDPRKERRKLHSIDNIVLISIAAVLCGAETWNEIEDFGKSKFYWLSSILDMPNGVPSHDTFNRFFSALAPGVFEKHFIEWTRSIIGNINNEYVSIDGKTQRLASKLQSSNGIHIVSAWASNNEATLGQIKTGEKSNEITAIPQLLDALFIENCVVTIDAMGCQKAIAEKIRKKKANYILAVKENHPTLYEEVKSSFSLQRAVELEVPIEADHGRIEQRKYSMISNLKHITNVADWKDCQSIVKVESTRIIKKTGEESVESRYFIASYKDLDSISKGIRLHWGIENRLHWVLDVAMEEDQSSKRAGHAAENFSLVKKLALNILRKDDPKISIRRKRKIAGWDNDYLLRLIETTGKQ